MNIFSKIIISVALNIASLFGFHQPIQPVSFGSFTPVGGSNYTLSGAGITSSVTTIQLTSFTLPDPNRTPISMSMLGSIGYGVLEPQTSRIEDITFTGVTQNANGTALLTGVSRGISFYTPYQASTTLALSHSGGATFILSNTAGFYGQQFLFANNAGTSTAPIVFSSTTPPRYDSVGLQAAGTYNATTSEFASVALVNKVVASGCATATESVVGCSQLATQLQMASSTNLGAGIPLALQSKYATSSPSYAGLFTPITQNNGKLAQFFWDLTQAFTWSGLHTFTAGLLTTASSTLNATTTIAASSVTNNALVLNSVAYRAPTAQGVAGTLLKNDGIGQLSWGGPARYNYIQETDFAAASGFATSTTKLGIPTGVGNASSTLDFYAEWENQQATCILYLSDDATGKPYISDTAPDGSTNNRSNAIHILIYANNSASSQQAVAFGVFSQVSGTVASGNFVGDITETTSAVNWANPFTVDVVFKGSGTSCSLRNYSMVFNP